MSTFIAVDDSLLIERIEAASFRIVFVAPAVSNNVAIALGNCFEKAGNVAVTVVLDSDEEPYRLGYGDIEGMQKLKQFAEDNLIGLRAQPGLRIGLLLVDHDVLIWSPTPKAVESQRTSDQPNGVDLGLGPGFANAGVLAVEKKSACITDANSAIGSLASIIQNAVGADDSDVLVGEAEIGRQVLTPDQIGKTINSLKANPPAPFDLSRKTRVFSSKFQFVEFELRGAEWTSREIKLSSLLINSDVPDELQDLFETRIKPFSHQVDVTISVPTLLQGQIAYDREGNEILSPMTQAAIERLWKELRDRYLHKLTGFGWLMRRADKERFEKEVNAFESILKAWVDGFREHAENEESTLVSRIVDLIQNRIDRSSSQARIKGIDVEATVLAGIKKLRVTEPQVKLVFKEISWESTRDAEFTESLRKAIPETELKGWFEVFTAARQHDIEVDSRST